MHTAHSEVRAEPVNLEDLMIITRADRYYRDWEIECERLPPGCRMPFAEWLVEAIDAEQYIPDEFVEAMPPIDCEPFDWDSIPY